MRSWHNIQGGTFANILDFAIWQPFKTTMIENLFQLLQKHQCIRLKYVHILNLRLSFKNAIGSKNVQWKKKKKKKK